MKSIRASSVVMWGWCMVWGLSSLWGFAQAPRGVGHILENGVFDDNIHSVYVGPADWSLAPPILSLQQGGALLLSFDYLGYRPPRLSYRVEHCTEEWVPSGMMLANRHDPYFWTWMPPPEASRGTQQPFLHYEVTIPNEFLHLSLSGHYVIIVCDVDQGHKVVLQRRFYVSEDIVKVNMTMRRGKPSMGGWNQATQRVDMTLELDRERDFVSASPSDFRVEMRKNWNEQCTRWLRCRSNFLTRTMDFGDFMGEEFIAGQEWYTLDLRSLTVAGEGVERMEWLGRKMHVQVQPLELGGVTDPWGDMRDARRREALPRSDLNGYCVPGMQSDFSTGRGSNFAYQPLESEYVWCYFSLRGKRNLLSAGRPVVQVGDRLYPMDYHAGRNQYEARILLKQGVYNYRYRLLDPCASTSELEGSFEETENEYYALVYYRDPRERYARLIGWGRKLSSDDGW